MRSQYNKHYRETDILDTARMAVEDILEKFHNIPNTTLAFVEKKSYKNFNPR